MNSIVVGATGMVGSHIVRSLVELGERPYALSRERHKESAEFEWLKGDLTDPLALRFPPAQVLYCTAPLSSLMPCLRVSRPSSLQRIVAITSTSIVTKIDSEDKIERSSLRRYADAEQELIRFCENHGLGWTILRPTLIYEEGRDHNISRLSSLIDRLGFLPLAGSGDGLRQPVHAEDVALGTIAAARSASTINKIYALPGLETITYREMIGRVFDGMNRPRRIVPIPPILWKMAFMLARPLLPGANAAMGSRMANDMTFDASDAIRDLAWAPRAFRPQFSKANSGR